MTVNSAPVGRESQMITSAIKPLACSPAGGNGRRVLSVLLAQALLLAGCASSSLERAPVAAEDASKRRNDALACSASDERLSGLLAESMLLGLTVGGGPAVIESGSAAKRRALKKCMDAGRPESIL